MEKKQVKKQEKKHLRQVEFALRIKRAHKKNQVFLTQEGLKHVEQLVSKQ